MSVAAPILINATDGSVRIETAALQMRMSMQLARGQLASRIKSERDLGNGHVWLSAGHASFGNRPADLSLCFARNELEMITLAVSLPDDEFFERWPTEESSLRQTKFLLVELQRQLNAIFIDGVADFAWGAAWSRFDPMGFMATAGIRYRWPL